MIRHQPLLLLSLAVSCLLLPGCGGGASDTGVGVTVDSEAPTEVALSSASGAGNDATKAAMGLEAASTPTNQVIAASPEVADLASTANSDASTSAVIGAANGTANVSPNDETSKAIPSADGATTTTASGTGTAASTANTTPADSNTASASTNSSANASATGSSTPSGSSSTPIVTMTPGTGGLGANPAPTGAIYVVGNSVPLPTGAIRVTSFSAVPWSSLQPDTTVYVSPGTYSGVITIAAAAGTQARPISVLPFDVTQPPVVNTIDVQGSAYLRVSGMTISSPNYAGIVIRNGTHHSIFSNNTIQNAPTGVSITTAAGAGNQILGNLISGSLTNGIGVDVNSTASDRTVIAHNLVDGSGVHGMEIHGSHYQIDYNTVTRSGLSSPGTSGIHLYSASASEDAGDDNLVRYNMTYNNFDSAAYDGNGIQVDHWCDNNVIEFNLSWSNDGPGIQIYDAINNVVQNNVVYGNMRDPGNTHAGGAELLLSASSLKRTASNVLRNNIVVSTRAGVPAFYVNSAAATNANSVGANMYYNTAGGYVMRWGDSTLQQTAAAIDAASGTVGSLVAMPAFRDVSSPLTGGFRLISAPAETGIYLPGLIDRAGQTAASASGWSFFGGYFFKL